jgi:regulator of protease activity HflC (stomatin/prohibitin superfamily)
MLNPFSLIDYPLQIEGYIGLFFIIIILLIILSSSLKVVKEFERIVVFRLGRLLGTKGPGLVIVLPFIDRVRKIDLRVLTLNVSSQKVVTKDNISVDVDAVIYFRVGEAIDAVMKVQDFILASSLLAQTTLRDVLGQVEFDDLLTKRENLNKDIQSILDVTTHAWGVKVTQVAIRDVAIPDTLERAIAKQAEAEREKRSRIIMAEGELIAAKKMSEASEFYMKSEAAMRLRELQTWSEVAREKNLIVVTEGTSASNLSKKVEKKNQEKVP